MFAASKTNAVAGGPDAQFNYVTMLLHGDGTNGAQNNTFVDSSTNNFTITRNGNTTQGSFSPYGSNWSVSFPNLASNLVLANSTPLNLSGGSFTIEGWINPSGIYVNDGVPYGLTGYNTIIAKRGYGTNAAWGVYLNTGNGYIGFYNQSTTYTSTTTPTAGVWSHFAVVFDGTNASLYFNGSRIIGPSSYTNTDYNESIYIGCTSQSGSNEQFRGSISNIRVTKGGALYSGSTYTVPTAPLTTTVSSGTVSLLTCQSNRFIDNSVNNATISVNSGLTANTLGNPVIQRFNPFGASTAYSTSVIGGSGYFDGNGDYLSWSGTTAMAVGTSAFTIEAWVYLNAMPTSDSWPTNWSNHMVIVTVGTPSLGDGFGFLIGSNRLFVQSNDTAYWSSSHGMTVGQWFHVAVSRTSTTLSFFVNGVAKGTNTLGSVGTGSSTYVGSETGQGAYLNGYISNIRILNGTSLYTTAFTPPTAPLTAITNTSLLLGMTNGAIFDNAMMNDLETVGNVQISTSVVKYGTGSLYFDGSTSNRIRPPASVNYAFGTGNFTVEAWVYVTNLSAENFVFDTRSSVSTAGMGFSLEPTTGKLRYSGNANNVLTSTGVSANVWTHIAWVRNGSTLTGYINGVSGGTASNSDNLTQTNGEVGNVPFATTVNTNMYIDDVRITKGYARYTANFTPPTAAFPNTGPI